MLNWLEGKADQFTRPGAVELEGLIHQDTIGLFASPESALNFLGLDRTYWRRQSIIKSQLVTGRIISGTVLEVGAGTGWCSSLISTLPGVDKVYAVDYDPIAVERLMPQVQKALGAQGHKIERVLGSFNHIPLDSEVDYVFSIGALHHSENLFHTLSECFKALKPGGCLVAAEPTFADSETNLQIHGRATGINQGLVKKHGLRTTFTDNSNHYYRLCEFLTAAYAAKFDVWPFVFDTAGDKAASDGMLSRRQAYTGFQPNVLFPYFAKNPANPVFDNLLLVMQKPADGGVDLGHVLTGSAPDF
ncbi:MAG: class I SAM-dependent methyltransferase [Rhodospirillaceae bacterium]